MSTDAQQGTRTSPIAEMTNRELISAAQARARLLREWPLGYYSLGKSDRLSYARMFVELSVRLERLVAAQPPAEDA